MKTFQVTAHPKKEHSGKAALLITPFILANNIHVWMIRILGRYGQSVQSDRSVRLVL